MTHPYMTIVTQPRRGCRFRYECEFPNFGTIFADRTSGHAKKWPSCQIHNYEGKVKVVVSLVTDNRIPKPHPHHLVGQYCSKGIAIYNFTITAISNIIEFPNMGIRRIRVADFRSSIAHRMLELRVNPYKGDYRNLDDVEDCVNAGAVCLCFQTYLLDTDDVIVGELDPIHSQVICNARHLFRTPLRIIAVDKDHGSCLGGDTIFLLCEKLSKNDVCILFRDGSWVDYARFHSDHVHNQSAIVFRTPSYSDKRITEKKKVQMRLYRPSDGKQSPPFDFYYLPQKCNRLKKVAVKRAKKRKLTDNSPPSSSSSSSDDDDGYDPYTMMMTPQARDTQNEINKVNDALAAIIEQKLQKPHPPPQDDTAIATTTSPGNDDVTNTEGESPVPENEEGGSPLVIVTSSEAADDAVSVCSSSWFNAADDDSDCSSTWLKAAAAAGDGSDSDEDSVAMEAINAIMNDRTTTTTQPEPQKPPEKPADAAKAHCSTSADDTAAPASGCWWSDEKCREWLQAQDPAEEVAGSEVVDLGQYGGVDDLGVDGVSLEDSQVFIPDDDGIWLPHL